ncbi:MAG TPA: hypothetical protein VM779_01880, partial [Thermoanaerobaculia bacterium]|nr:hypothetical protein [Thermoanaerobaculia bacterium]
VRHLTTGRVAKLISMAPEHLFKPVVSADGTKLAFWRIERAAQPAATFATDLQRTPDGSLLAATPRQLPALAPEGSGWPWGWSPDNRSLWYDTARWPKLAPNHLYNPATGERLAQLAHKEHDLAFLQFSPDGRWIAFMEPLTENLNRLVAASMRGGTPAAEQEWVEIADPEPGAYPWHAWSPNGDIIYFTSARDGFVCIWAQRVAPDTMRLVDSAVALHHAHSARLSIGNIGPNLRGLAAARDKVVFTMSEMTGNIWITDIDNP